MKKIAIYGKGGIGKSSTVANMAAALALCGKKVMQIGCDPKADSTSLLRGGAIEGTILDLSREKGNNIALSEMVTEGFAGTLCVEAGGPKPGTGCAGRGIIIAFGDSDSDYRMLSFAGEKYCVFPCKSHLLLEKVPHLEKGNNDDAVAHKLEELLLN